MKIIKIDVRFHQAISPTNINDWASYYWVLGQKLTEIIIDKQQSRSLTWQIFNHSPDDKRTKANKFYLSIFEGNCTYETDFGALKIMIK